MPFVRFLLVPALFPGLESTWVRPLVNVAGTCILGLALAWSITGVIRWVGDRKRNRSRNLENPR